MVIPTTATETLSSAELSIQQAIHSPTAASANGTTDQTLLCEILTNDPPMMLTVCVRIVHHKHDMCLQQQNSAKVSYWVSTLYPKMTSAVLSSLSKASMS
jgi:hypothetical protein